VFKLSAVIQTPVGDRDTNGENNSCVLVTWFPTRQKSNSRTNKF